MNIPNVIEFKGLSGSGKTSSIETLIQFLKNNGFNVSAIKKIHQENFSIDTPGKNTWRMSEAGSNLVISSSGNETAFILKNEIDLNSLIRINDLILNEVKKAELFKERNLTEEEKKCIFIEDTAKTDYIFAEGYYNGKYPLVITIKQVPDLLKILDLISMKKNKIEILKSIFAISGSFLQDNTNLEMKCEKQAILSLIHDYSKELFAKFEMDIRKIIEKINIINIKENPAYFIEKFEQIIK